MPYYFLYSSPLQIIMALRIVNLALAAVGNPSKALIAVLWVYSYVSLQITKPFVASFGHRSRSQ
jgi:hypothetical protein